MKVYHTGKNIIKEPDIYYGRKNADFGQGFYVTPDMDFALRWAWQDAVLNQYELDLNDLVITSLNRDIEWVRYIFQNRRFYDSRSSDIIIGPIANDTIFDTFGIISSGFLSEEESLQLLSIGPEYVQIALKSERSVQHLEWIGSKQITAVKQNESEQSAYLKQFAEKMEEICGDSEIENIQDRNVKE